MEVTGFGLFPSWLRRGTMGIEVVQVVSLMESQGDYGDCGVQVVSLMELQGGLWRLRGSGCWCWLKWLD